MIDMVTSIGFKFGRWVAGVLMRRGSGAGERALPGAGLLD
jgi:hypothetical protein